MIKMKILLLKPFGTLYLVKDPSFQKVKDQPLIIESLKYTTLALLDDRQLFSARQS